METYQTYDTIKNQKKRPPVRKARRVAPRLEAPEAENREEGIFSVVVETSNYRVEIEIG